MFAILKKLVGGRSAKGRKAAAGFRPALEALEGRDLMSVAGYSAVGMKDFFIDPNHNLGELDQYGTYNCRTSSAAQVSVLQGTSHASARADVLKLDGTFWQWDDATGMKSIASGVKQVSAGFNGNSAVVFTNGDLSLYNADTGVWTGLQANIDSASIGLDLNNGTMVDMVTTNGYGYEWRAPGGVATMEPLGATTAYVGVKQISAGVGGHSAILLTNSCVWDHTDASYASTGAFTGPGTSTYIDCYVASVSCGTDAVGNVMIDEVKNDTSAWEHSSTSNSMKFLGNYVSEVDAECGGKTYVSSTYVSSTNTYTSIPSINRYNDNTGLGYADSWTSIVTVSPLNKNNGGLG